MREECKNELSLRSGAQPKVCCGDTEAICLAWSRSGRAKGIISQVIQLLRALQHQKTTGPIQVVQSEAQSKEKSHERSPFDTTGPI